MHRLLLFGCGVAPALVALWLFDRLDRKRPEPAKVRRAIAIAGGLAMIPIALTEEWLAGLGPKTGYPAALFTAFVVAAGTEELAKAICLRIMVWNRPEFDERMDGIVYAARAALGFALVENVLYMIKSSSEAMGMFIIIALIRALISVPGHPLYASVMGYYAARRRFDRVGPGIVGGYLMAVLLHGTFDGALMCAPFAVRDLGSVGYALLGVPVIVVLFSFITVRRLARAALAADDADPRYAAAPAAAPA